MPHRLLALLVATMASFVVATATAGTLGEYRQLVLNGHQLKWGEPVLGAGATVTYALAAARMDFVAARNCRGLAPIAGLLAENRVDPAVFERELVAAFAAWQAVADITFRQTEPASADIIIGIETDPLGRAFTNVAYDQAPGQAGPRRLKQSVICLNPEENWKVGFDGDLDRYDLRYTLMHEIGHAIGLDHPPKRNAVMDFAYRERFRSLQPGDIAGAVAIYGPPKPATETPVVASDDKAKPDTVAR